MFLIPKPLKERRWRRKSAPILPPSPLNREPHLHPTVFDSTRSVRDASFSSRSSTRVPSAANNGVEWTSHLQNTTVAVSEIFSSCSLANGQAGRDDDTLTRERPLPTLDATVVGESHTNNDLLMGQSYVAGSALSACNSELQSLPALSNIRSPQHLPTDPSPFTSPTMLRNRLRASEPVDSVLRLGGQFMLVLNGQKLIGRVMDIRLADGMRDHLGENLNREPNQHDPHVQPPMDTLREAVHTIPVHHGVEEHPLCTPDLQLQKFATTGGNDIRIDSIYNNTISSQLAAPAHSDGSRDQVYPSNVSGNFVPTYRSGLSEHNTTQQLYMRIPLLQSTKIKPKQTFQCAGVLGKGSFGKVYLVLRTADKQQYAMKIHDLRGRMCLDKARGLLKELFVHHLTRGPFLLGMIDMWYSSAGFLHVVTQFCPGGDLSSRIKKLSDIQMLLVVAEVIIGLTSLHEKGIIHHDLKPENILIDAEGHIIISDFGLSVVDRAPAGTVTMARMGPPGGTALYMAPEIDTRDNNLRIYQKMAYWDHGIDYWALGATIFKLQTGKNLLDFSDDGWERQLEHPLVHEEMCHSRSPSTLITLVEKLTRFNRFRRWKGERVREAEYFRPLNKSRHGWSAIYAKEYAPFRLSAPTPVTADKSSQININADDRPWGGEESVDLYDLIDALRSYEIFPRQDDDCLVPGKDFIPRHYEQPGEDGCA